MVKTNMVFNMKDTTQPQIKDLLRMQISTKCNTNYPTPTKISFQASRSPCLLYHTPPTHNQTSAIILSSDPSQVSQSLTLVQWSMDSCFKFLEYKFLSLAVGSSFSQFPNVLPNKVRCNPKQLHKHCGKTKLRWHTVEVELLRPVR